ncbi:hypothetical protein SAMN02746041_01848 [Desulfacinum hydrothermale DSM 13146]|uniref:Transposase n=1 Tax=Desulfacinum hydrothermale DSM 13146 TaxID=1121390 RepID=A0A1W1XK21_9BACT|nr:hypothetical protein [Desulfacinum hydrothermale]SMC23901.1 hypothetical protein SAMN02746041_01848 [Desulfacinum hydrothermale DSM 13146]
MFIRRARKKDPQTGKTYFYHQLVESYRTPSGPRQRTLLNLGRLDLEPKELRRLAKRIEDQMKGQPSIAQPKHIEELALHFVSLLRKKRIQAAQAEPEKQGDKCQTVDIDSVQTSDVRTVGAEAVGAWAYDQLQMTKILKECAFTQADIDRAKVLILGKLIHPASERETHAWFHQRSALDEVMDINAKHVSLTSLYRTCDRLLSRKEDIEASLVNRERSLFGLGEKLILYDLTNTYFEGNPNAQEAQRGVSKEKRPDRPL